MDVKVKKGVIAKALSSSLDELTQDELGDVIKAARQEMQERRNVKKVPVNVMVPEPLLARLDKAWAGKFRSRNAMIIVMMERWLDSED